MADSCYKTKGILSAQVRIPTSEYEDEEEEELWM